MVIKRPDMNAIPFPLPDASIVARREVIIAALSKLVAPDCLITSEDERRAFDTDALTAYCLLYTSRCV